MASWTTDRQPASGRARRDGGTITLVLFVVALLLPAPAAAQPSRYEAPADLFYLHPLVNYSEPVRWRAEFERERLAHGGALVSVGSISTKDFATLARVEVVEPWSDHLRFLYRLDWTDSPHLDGPERQNWLGVELGGLASPAGVLGLEIVVNAPSDKGDLDLLSSVVWTDASRRRYLRLGWRRDDFLYGDKSDVEAVLDDEAAGPAWTAHFERGPWAVSSEGALLGLQRRRYPDATLSPVLEETRLRRTWSSTAVRHDTGTRLVELRVDHRDFERARLVRADAPFEEDLRRSSRWRHLRLALEQDFGPHWRVRLQAHRLHYDHTLDGIRHRRDENLGGVFLERAVGAGHWIDLGLMGTDYAWTTTPPSQIYGPDRDRGAMKVGLGWTVEFPDRGRFRALLSHEPDPQQFGGANVQAQVLF